MLNKHDLAQWDILNEIEYGYLYDDIYGKNTSDVELLLSLIGDEPKNILEAFCGSGRLFIPLAKTGHKMTGFDAHYGMLSRLHQKAKGLSNVRYYYADALRHEWETGFDVVLVANNVIQNIDHIGSTDPKRELADYIAAQELIISKAAQSLVRGGYLFFTFELYDIESAENTFVREPDPEWFTDPDAIDVGNLEAGLYGIRKKTVNGGDTYDHETRFWKTKRRDITIYPPHGEKHITEYTIYKHNLSLDEARKLLTDNGLTIVQEYGDTDKRPLVEGKYNGEASFWAKK